MSSETYHCWYPVQIRFRDLDPLAHVNNTVYFVYLEEARSFYFDRLKPWRHADETPVQAEEEEADGEHNPRIKTGPRGYHYGMLVKENTCTYLLPLVRSDRAEVGVKVVKIGRTSFVMEHEIRDSTDHSRVFATGRSVLVWCNYHTGRPHPIPPTLRAAFEEFEGLSSTASGSSPGAEQA
ncbi:acyl-CoA thioesterase [Dictyobacter formicarum]|uniref:Thioesterase n=1 Tax=Dictyobacter formicarum TaxID=2778368 RepID=A0ABQ3VSL3_9CHLR|nr:thioesterase family protein [Dictyobacter formicarum]GHO88716.1 hypothetical protein KSZ_67220 [Dictyobacter formicarum]